MTGNPTVDGIIAAIGALAAAWGLWAGGRKALADARALKMPPATPYEALATRLTALEASDAEKRREIHRLDAKIRRLTGLLVREVADVISWVDSSRRAPVPEQEVEVIKEMIRSIEHDEEKVS